MLNVLSDMVEVWAGLGGGEGARGCGGTDPAIDSTILNVPNTRILYTGSCWILSLVHAC